jgi:hypothetical protein
MVNVAVPLGMLSDVSEKQTVSTFCAKEQVIEGSNSMKPQIPKDSHVKITNSMNFNPQANYTD